MIPHSNLSTAFVCCGFGFFVAGIYYYCCCLWIFFFWQNILQARLTLNLQRCTCLCLPSSIFRIIHQIDLKVFLFFCESYLVRPHWRTQGKLLWNWKKSPPHLSEEVLQHSCRKWVFMVGWFVLSQSCSIWCVLPFRSYKSPCDCHTLLLCCSVVYVNDILLNMDETVMNLIHFFPLISFLFRDRVSP